MTTSIHDTMLDIFGPIKAPTQEVAREKATPPEKKAATLKAVAPGPAAGSPDRTTEPVTPEISAAVLEEIYGGAIPEVVTQQGIIEQAEAYIRARIERDGFCVLRGWPAWLYHSLPFIGSTLLKGYAELPATARTPWVPSDDGAVGTAIHAYTLQGKEALYEECCILPPDCEGKSKSALASRQWYASQHPTKAMVPHVYGTEKVPIMDILRGVDNEYRNHPKTSTILANCETELSLIWIDEETGLTCKARLDVWAAPIIWDVKKTRSVDGFKWQIKDLYYGVQAGHYTAGAQACRLGPVAFGFLPCEAVPPFRVGCGYRDPERLKEDVFEAKRLLKLLKESQLTNFWPAYRAPEHIHSWADLVPDDLVDVY